MDVEFTPRGTGWRGRGKRRPSVPKHIMQALQKTYEDEIQGNIPHDGASEREIRDVILMLERGAKLMGRHLRAQWDDEAIRFWVEDKKL